MVRQAFQVFHCHRRFTMESIKIPPPTLTSFNKYRKVSNIDQRVTVPSRHTAAITVPCRFIGARESGSTPARFNRGVCTENLNPNVLTMKSAQYGARIYDAGSLNLARDRRIFVQ